MGADETELYAIAAVQFQLEFPRTQMGLDASRGGRLRSMRPPRHGSEDRAHEDAVEVAEAQLQPWCFLRGANHHRYLLQILAS